MSGPPILFYATANDSIRPRSHSKKARHVHAGVVFPMTNCKILLQYSVGLACIFGSAVQPSFAQTQSTAPNAAQLTVLLNARDLRANLLRDEIRELDQRIEQRVKTIIDGLSGIADSKDSRTKVARLKE